MVGRKELVTERQSISLSLTPHLGKHLVGYPTGLLLSAVITHLMVALTAVDDIRAATLCRDVVGTAVTFVAVPCRWCSGWSLLGTITQ